MRNDRPNALTGAVLALALVLSACGKGEDKNAAAEAEKKAQEAAAAELKEPIALLSAYLPYLKPAETKDRYTPKRRPDEDRSTAYAAEEIRHVANSARQSIKGDSPVIKDLVTALQNVSTSCTGAEDPEAIGKCSDSVDKLNETLKKSESASQGGAVKFPRVGPESVTEQAKKEIAAFLKAKGPGDATKAYVAKRSDANVSPADLSSACQAAMDEAGSAAMQFEKAAEPIRLIAVTRKMSMESQCGLLNATETLHKDLKDCRKKAKTPDCKAVCGKAKARVDDGIPAAAFLPLEKDFAEICTDK
ncbi:MAG: hypothetical protein HUU21_04165 [Polyangiaceae bacterium]|nr:hypothetical protein [Polyangiaceae bacterium]NUQ72730.1 hypothetical protein [Polyangiaceae bacterium]